MLCEHARKATTVVPKRYRHLSKVPKRCPARTVGHPKVIKGARHVPGPIRELVNITYPTRPWPLYSPPHQVLSLGLQDLVRVTVWDS